MEKLLDNYSPYFYAILRVVAGLLFACNGAKKLFGLFGGMGKSGAPAEFLSQMWFAGAIEFIGGLLIAAGLLTGLAAFIASGEMAVAYFQGHFPEGFWPIVNNGERAVLYCFIFLYVASRGAVAWGLDCVLQDSSRRGGRRTPMKAAFLGARH